MMLTVMREFMRNIVTFSVLSAFCMQVLPTQKYHTYAGFAIGLIYICMLLDTVGELLGKTAAAAGF